MHSQPIAAAIPTAFTPLPALLRLWLQRARQRRRLATLDAHLLRDVGLTRQDALAEAGKPFWAA